MAGVLLGAFSAAGLWVDVGNNWAYGLTVSHEAAIVLAAAAIGVAAFPAVAAVRGWSWLLASGAAACIVLTVGAAFLAYTAKQGATADQRKATAAAYQSARQDEAAARAEEAAARAEASAIAETASADELQVLVEEAKAKSDREADRKGCGARCEAAKDAYAALLSRLGQARTKAAALERAEAARARISQAQAHAKAGPASAPLSALWIAARGGWKVEEVDANVNVGLAALMIVFTQILAWCAHPAVKCIAWGLERPAEGTSRRRPAAAEAPAILQPAVELAMPASRPRKRSARTAPAALVEQVQRWAGEALVSRSGAAVAAGDVFAAFQAEAGGDITQAAFGAAMAEAGFNKAKRGGRVVYLGVAFRQALRLAAGG